MQSPPPTEYFPGIQFNPYYYQSWDEPVTKLYVDTNYLRCTGYAYSRSIATTFSGVINADGGIQTTNITASGTITANVFNGSGASLTSLNASNINTGTLSVARGGTGTNTFLNKRLLIGDGTNPITTTPNLIYDTSTNTLYPINIGANGSGLTNLNVSNATDGTLTVARGGTGSSNFTLGRLLLGNGTSAITENGNLTWTTATNTLNVTGTATATTMSSTNIGIGVTNPTASLEIVRTTVAAITDIIMMKRDESNHLRISQLYVGSNDIKQIFYQFNAGVENAVLTFYKNSIGIGTTDPGLFKLDVGGTARASVLTAPTIGIGITNPTATSLYILNTQTTEKDVIAMNYDGSNGLKIRQAYVAANDIKYTFYETRNNVITDAMTIYKGSVGIGTTTPGAFTELDVVGTTRSTALTANNIGIGITNPTTSLLDIVSPITTASDLINLRYDDSNGLKIQQDYVAVNDFKQSLVQRNNGGNTNILTFYKGNVGIGTTTPAATDKLSVTGNTKITGTATIDTNLVVGGSAGIVGTSQFTGNMGIGTAASVDANIKLVVSGDINIIGNNRYRIGGNAIGSWLAGAVATNIYYNAGNVGIGATTTSDADDNTSFAIPTAPLYVRGGASTGGTCDVVIRGGVAGQNNGKSRLWLLGDSSHASYIQSEHTGSGNTQLTFGTANGNVLPTERMIITNAGNVGIGITNPTNIFQVGNGGRLRIGTNSDFTLIGGNDIDNNGNSRVVLVGSSSTSNPNSVFYLASGTGYHSFETTNSRFGRLIIANNGDIGIGVVNPVYKCHIRCGYNNVATGLHLDANDNGNANQYSLTIWPYVQGGGQVGWRFRTQSQDGGDRTPLQFYHNGDALFGGYLTISTGCSINSDVFITSSRLVLRGTSPTLYLRDTDNRSSMIHCNGNNLYFLNGSGNDSETWAQQNGQDWALRIDMNNNNAFFGGQITAYFVSVSQTDTDHVVVQLNYGFVGQGANLTLKVAFGTFTGFHRCYTDDILYNNDTPENIDLFKNNYMGRVVIATGKIKTDFTRQVEAEGEAEIDGITGLPREKEKIDEWYSGIDKDGISIEDAVPVVALSRKKKDKRVFGVLGAPKRNTNNMNRLIVNSVGEGGICVSNTNGNIENGDFIQSSELLGYGEKQDDDLLHNYTIAKSTIDCNFELNSPYYQCHEIENDVRVAFIACSYHCG